MFTLHNGGVQILCSYPENVRQFKMQLMKENQTLCELTKTNTVSVKNIAFCKSQLSNNSVSFFLYNLNSSYSSYYLCNLTTFEPPPYKSEIQNKEYLYVYESQLCLNVMKSWLPIGCTAFILIYIFACVSICWFTKRKRRSSVHDPNSEYMFMAAMPNAKKPGGT
ncbi:Inducible T-cell costimulator, partial [Galemys pyrenaicus]